MRIKCPRCNLTRIKMKLLNELCKRKARGTSTTFHLFLPAINSPTAPSIGILGRTNSVKPCRDAQFVACLTATAGAPLYNPRIPLSRNTFCATRKAETHSPSFSFEAATHAVTINEVGPITRLWAAPPPAPLTNPIKLGGIVTPMRLVSAGAAKSDNAVCRPSFAASRTPPLKRPSIIRGDRPDHNTSTPCSRMIDLRIANEDGGGVVLLLLLLFMFSSTTDDFHTSSGCEERMKKKIGICKCRQKP